MTKTDITEAGSMAAKRNEFGFEEFKGGYGKNDKNP